MTGLVGGVSGRVGPGGPCGRRGGGPGGAGWGQPAGVGWGGRQGATLPTSLPSG